MDTRDRTSKRYVQMLQYLKEAGYTEEESLLLFRYLESIIVPIFDKYYREFYEKRKLKSNFIYK